MVRDQVQMIQPNVKASYLEASLSKKLCGFVLLKQEILSF